MIVAATLRGPDISSDHPASGSAMTSPRTARRSSGPSASAARWWTRCSSRSRTPRSRSCSRSWPGTRRKVPLPRPGPDLRRPAHDDRPARQDDPGADVPAHRRGSTGSTPTRCSSCLGSRYRSASSSSARRYSRSPTSCSTPRGSTARASPHLHAVGSYTAQLQHPARLAYDLPVHGADRTTHHTHHNAHQRHDGLRVPLSALNAAQRTRPTTGTTSSRGSRSSAPNKCTSSLLQKLLILRDQSGTNRALTVRLDAKRRAHARRSIS